MLGVVFGLFGILGLLEALQVYELIAPWEHFKQFAEVFRGVATDLPYGEMREFHFGARPCFGAACVVFFPEVLGV